MDIKMLAVKNLRQWPSHWLATLNAFFLFGIAAGTTPQDAIRVNFSLGIATIWTDAFGPELARLDGLLWFGFPLLLLLPEQEGKLRCALLVSRFQSVD